jgi:5-(carboxyamino)imidazole ribonucleotide mutase
MAEEFTTVPGALVGVLMGSASDWPTMKRASDVLGELSIAHECNAISAHRAPERLERYVRSAEERGVRILVCGAGGAAHLAGVVAAMTHLPVLACPMKAWALDGLDSLLSMVQMPKGIPVATFAIGPPGATNAGLFAAAVLGLADADVRRRLLAYRRRQSAEVTPLPAE